MPPHLAHSPHRCVTSPRSGVAREGHAVVQRFRSAMREAPLDRVLLLGAGGAGKAVGRALCDLGAGHIDIFDLDPERSTRLAAGLNSSPGVHHASIARDLAVAARSATGLVNATPMGMAKYPGMPLPPDELRADLWVADIVYLPEETDLLSAAAAAGSRTMSGKSMAVFQAVKAFELITGRRPDTTAMFGHFASAAAGLPRVN